MTQDAPGAARGEPDTATRTVAESRPAPSSAKPHVFLGPGERIADRYEVLSVEGEGGMGVVYRCRDRGGELVAVKRVTLPRANAQEHLGWFEAEARALAALSHPNIVGARDFGQLKDGTPYLVMELAAGLPLPELLGEPLEFPLLWLLVDQLLAALAHAHARGVVHGDLKPSNLIVATALDGGPSVRLLDFGLARRLRSDLDPRLGQRSLTFHPPPNAGTPGYMAPEQILGKRSEICAATDLFALGCLLYRALSGRAPAPPKAVEREVPSEPARPPVPRGYPAELVTFVMELLARSPAARIGSAAELRRLWRYFEPVRRSGIEQSLRRAAERRSRSDDGLSSTRRETTRRLSPRPSRVEAGLARSSRFLPGLLSVRRSPLVGRGALCRELAEGCRELAGGFGPRQRAIVLTGPAGVGKSRLADWLCDEVEEQGLGMALRGHRWNAVSARDGLALALCDRYGLGDAALRSLPVALHERCAPGDLGAVIDFGLRAAHPAALPHGRTALESARSLVRVLSEMARGQPLLLWLDDLAALSEETRALFLLLQRERPEQPVLVITTARPETLADPAASASLSALRARLPTEFVSVAPLDALAISALIRAAHPIDAALALEIAIESDGIPLAALERLYELARRGCFA